MVVCWLQVRLGHEQGYAAEVMALRGEAGSAGDRGEGDEWGAVTCPEKQLVVCMPALLGRHSQSSCVCAVVVFVWLASVAAGHVMSMGATCLSYSCAGDRAMNQSTSAFVQLAPRMQHVGIPGSWVWVLGFCVSVVRLEHAFTCFKTT
jgi:hypothetical protein